MTDFEGAEGREIADLVDDVAGGFGHDDFGGVIFGIWVGVDELAGEIIGDFDVKNSIGMDIAVVGDEGGEVYGGGKSKGGDVVF